MNRSKTPSADYDFHDLPKVSNILLYNYRCFMKLFWIFVIGTGSVLLAVFVFPVLRLLFHPQKKFRYEAQRFVSASFRFFMFLLKISHIVKIVSSDKKKLYEMHSKVIVANHPSILDTVVLASLIPNTTVIAAEKYAKGILGGVIRSCYITNSVDFNELCSRCCESLKMGSNVLIFPEGTRTPRHGQNKYKKGAARIARACNTDIVPLFVGGSDKFGLGKNNPFWCFNPVEQLVYHIICLDEIKTENYKEYSDPVGAKRLTQDISEAIHSAAEEYKKDHPYTRTVNNV